MTDSSTHPMTNSIIPDRFAPIHRRQLLQQSGIDLFRNEPDRAIGPQHRTAGVAGFELCSQGQNGAIDQRRVLDVVAPRLDELTDLER